MGFRLETADPALLILFAEQHAGTVSFTGLHDVIVVRSPAKPQHAMAVLAAEILAAVAHSLGEPELLSDNTLTGVYHQVGRHDVLLPLMSRGKLTTATLAGNNHVCITLHEHL